MKITIQSIPHATQRYPTCGDWEVMPDGSLEIRVSEEMGEDSGVLVAVHELIEAKVALRRGVTVKQVDDFDTQFELAHRQGGTLDGERTDNDEPGDDPACPVFREHQFCTAIEAIVCAMMDIPWPEHAKRVEALP